MHLSVGLLGCFAKKNSRIMLLGRNLYQLNDNVCCFLSRLYSIHSCSFVHWYC